MNDSETGGRSVDGTARCELDGCDEYAVEPGGYCEDHERELESRMEQIMVRSKRQSPPPEPFGPSDSGGEP